MTQSMGGMIAQELAIRHPFRVRSLALLYTASNRDFLAGRELVEDRMARPHARNRDEAIALYLENEAASASPGYPQDTAWLHELGGQMFDHAAAAVIHRHIPDSTLTTLPGMGHELPRPLWTDIVELIRLTTVRERART